MTIFSGSANITLAKQIAEKIGTKLAPLEIHLFPDGEKRVRILENVLEKDVVIIQSTNFPVEVNYMELFFIADAAKRNGAKTITAVVPYLGYERQDHLFREGEAVSLDVVASMLSNTGVSKLIVFDLHSIKTVEEFKIPFVHLSALPLFAEKIKEKNWQEDTVLVSPDMGGGRRIKILSELLGGMPFASIEKNRDLESGNVSASIIHGNVKKRAIIVDDIIASGKTIAIAAGLLSKNGVTEIYVFATHPVFTHGAAQTLQNANVEKVFVANTINVPQEKQFAKLEILSVAETIAENLTS